MDDLVAFLRQRLAKDEQVIREAAGDYFYAEGHGDAVNRWFDRWSPDNPDGMIAEVEAKRRILDEHPHEPAAPWGTTEVTSVGCATCHDNGEGVIGKGWCRTVRLLAQRYAGWPGWRDEWAI